MLAVLASVQRGEVDVEETDANVLFARLTSFVRPVQLGSLEQHEFRLVAKPLGLSMLEADKAFACLDHYPGSTHAPPASIDVTDIQWLKKLVTLVDTDAVACMAQDVSSAMQPPASAGESPSTAKPPPVDPSLEDSSAPPSPDTGRDMGIEEDEDFEDDDEYDDEGEEEEEEFDEDEEEEDEDEPAGEETW
jgi:hypothetical protein